MTSHFSRTGVEKNVALHALSLFAGVGGLDLGVGLARNHRTICYVEREIYPASVLAARMADKTLDEAPIWSDLATFDSKPWRGCVDLITASPPCQPYSVAGARQGLDDERGGAVLEHLARIIDEVRPPLVFMENVGEWVTGGYFRDFGERLSGLGYRIPPPLFVTAGSVGAPHRRERIFILAHDDRGGCRRQQKQPRLWQGRTQRGHDADSSNSAVAAAGRERRQTASVQLRDGGKTSRIGETNKHRGSSNDVADPQQQGPQGRTDEPGRTGQDDGATGRSCRGIFPPNPNDDAWATVLDREPGLAPALEPGFRRVVNELAYNLDERANRLRATGNGVVPLAAAVAFDVLLTEIGL